MIHTSWKLCCLCLFNIIRLSACASPDLLASSKLPEINEIIEMIKKHRCGDKECQNIEDKREKKRREEKRREEKRIEKENKNKDAVKDMHSIISMCDTRGTCNTHKNRTDTTYLRYIRAHLLCSGFVQCQYSAVQTKCLC